MITMDKLHTDKKTEIIAERSPYPKCSRCWNHKEDCAYSSYWLDTLCSRCAKILCSLEEKGEWFPGKQNMIKFPNRHMIYPVIHVEDKGQAIKNTLIAKKTGCDGVFLINHKIDPETLLEIHAQVAKAVPDWWIGINCLGFTPRRMFQHATPEMSGIWVDNAGIEERSLTQVESDNIKRYREESEWKGIYFGGVAFKYQREVKNLETACRIAMKYVDVVTTSGPGTAQAAAVNKIQRMKNALGEWPLAIASGITIDNIESYLDKATHFLVASGINESWAHLDKKLVRQLVEKIRNSSENGD